MPPTFHIRDLPIEGDAILAPMDGYSDLPFRSICRELGSAVSYTEFINAIDIVQKHPHVQQRLRFLPQERPVVFQLFDNNPERLLQAALRLQEHAPDVIDINLGCSARTVSGRGAGAGLLCAPLKIAEIFSHLTRALSVPVTAKMRLGWDDSTLNYLEVARIIEQNGGALIAVHGRTRQQAYTGQANWDAIAEVRQAVSIPVIGNGDVRTVADIARMKAHTGCPAVMIGRGAVDNPWIFARLDREQVPQGLIQHTLLRQLERSLELYGQPHGLVVLRKFAVRYLKPYNLEADFRRRLLTTQQPDEFIGLLARIFDVA